MRDTPADAGPPVAAPQQPSPAAPPPPGPPPPKSQVKTGFASRVKATGEAGKTKHGELPVSDPREVMREQTEVIRDFLTWHEGLLAPVADDMELAALKKIGDEAEALLGNKGQAPDEDLVGRVAQAFATTMALNVRPLPENDELDIEEELKRVAEEKARQRAAEAPNGEPEPKVADDDSPKTEEQQVRVQLDGVSSAPELAASKQWAARLIDEGKYHTASYVIDQTYRVVRYMGMAEKAAKLDNAARTAELRQPELVNTAVGDLVAGKFDSVRAAIKGLKDDAYLPSDEGHPKYKALIGDVFASPALKSQATQAPDVFADLLVGAIKLSRVKPDAKVVEVTGADVKALRDALPPDAAPAVAANLLKRHWRNPVAFDQDTLNWMIANIDAKAWNDPGDGLAARAYNMLWHAGDYPEMIRLIDKGVSPRLPASDGSDSGRNREGVWSGFVQPLEHLLGNYVRLCDPKISATEKMTDDERKKVAGAAKLLEVLGARTDTTIVTTWKEIKDCQVITGFDKAPGTIWGFEDVRLPYVQAAHESAEGQRPLRMIEIWDAVEKALNARGYPALLANPDKVINDCLKAGVKKLQEGLKEKPREYYGRESGAFEAQFQQQARAYLTFLARQTPEAKLAIADLSGKRPDKWMGALGCKAGLWWAAEAKEPIYYVLDGLNERDAIDYKAYKTKKINERMADPLKVQAFGEVITLSEVREILNHWDKPDQKMRTYVKFVERGRILEGADLNKIDGWVKEMKEADATTKRIMARTGPSKEALEPKLKGLDTTNPNLRAEDESTLKHVVLQADLVKMAANAHFELLSGALDNCKELYKNLLLPEAFRDDYKVMLGLPLDKRLAAAAVLKDTYLTPEKTASALIKPLRAAVDRWASSGLIV
ncbi:hypothetical protein AB0J72_23845 [Dactylosporangium sp. NPDC049742]|uniref:hypothetical protein n=1 Tax=Dactylosporangium sp. NPDC049742 TaxID=3154737 RepID=UPI0034241B04